MTTLDQDIRAGLQKRLITTSGFPASGNRAFEGLEFTPTVGEAWAKMTLIPTGNEAYLTGATNTQTGLFQVDLYEPPGLGTGGLEALVNAVKDKFRPATRINLAGGEWLEVINVERVGAIFSEADFMRAIVQVRWRVHSARL